jgi:MarR family transcriptional regulator for hemolysin
VETKAEFALELGRVSRRWRARLDERLKHTGLTQARWIALLHLSRSGPLAQCELAERIGIEGPTLVRVLDNLEEQGLIKRRPSSDDRRVKQLCLTDAAGPILTEITRICDDLRQELLADLPAKDIAVARKVMRAIADRLEGR